MHPYYEPLADIYQQNANQENAHWMKRYMKDKFEFFGIKTPDRTNINRKFFHQNGLPEFAELPNIIESLMNEKHREFHYFAISLAGKMKRQWEPNTWRLFEKMITTNSWWDTVDALASNNCGVYFIKFPDLTRPVTQPWNSNGNIWLIRSSILFQLQYKKDTDSGLLFSYIVPHLDSKEFFIQKAIGWALRQYMRTDANAVLEFVDKHKLPALSRREALKGVAVRN